MIARIYQLTGSVTRSVRRAVLVDEVTIDEIPANQFDFAADHGGDFIEVVREALVGDPWPSTSL